MKRAVTIFIGIGFLLLLSVQAFGPIGGGGRGGATGCGQIGEVCSDGTIYAGKTVGGARIYVADADEPGRYRYGGYGTDLNGDNDTLPPELLDDGLGNTNALADSLPKKKPRRLTAAQACRDRGPDWYLPAKDELNTLYENRVAINASAAAYFAEAPYWSSTEFSAFHAWLQSFSSGKQYNNNKATAYKVRCLHR